MTTTTPAAIVVLPAPARAPRKSPLATCPFSGYPRKHCHSSCTHRVIERERRNRRLGGR